MIPRTPKEIFSIRNNIYDHSITSCTTRHTQRRDKTRQFLLKINLIVKTLLLLSQIPFFEDVGVMTLTYLDLLVQKDNLQKSQFFKGLPKVVGKLPKVISVTDDFYGV